MDKSELNLLDVMRKAVEDNNEIYSKVCKVEEIDLEKEEITAAPLDDTAPILSVRLTVAKGDTNFVCIPKQGSFVIVTFLSEETAFVSLCSEIETIRIRGDQFGGLVKIEELKSQLDIVTARIDTLYDAINNAVPVAQDGGAALQTAMKTTLASQIQKENYDNIENENIKHG